MKLRTFLDLSMCLFRTMNWMGQHNLILPHVWFEGDEGCLIIMAIRSVKEHIYPSSYLGHLPLLSWFVGISSSLSSMTSHVSLDTFHHPKRVERESSIGPNRATNGEQPQTEWTGEWPPNERGRWESGLQTSVQCKGGGGSGLRAGVARERSGGATAQNLLRWRKHELEVVS
jgi:hypothetical protein